MLPIILLLIYKKKKKKTQQISHFPLLSLYYVEVDPRRLSDRHKKKGKKKKSQRIQHRIFNSYVLNELSSICTMR